MKCPECKIRINKKKSYCPHCGVPINKSRTSKKELSEETLRFISDIQKLQSLKIT